MSCMGDMLLSFRLHSGADAIIWRDQVYNYCWLGERVRHWHEYLVHNDLKTGTVVALEADYSPNAVALVLALLDAGCQLVPVARGLAATRDAVLEVACPELMIAVDEQDEVSMSQLDARKELECEGSNCDEQQSRLVFVTATAGGQQTPSFVSIASLVTQTEQAGAAQRMLVSLPFGSRDGLQAVLGTLAHGGCLVTITDRSNGAVLQAIERHRVDVLPIDTARESTESTEWKQLRRPA